MLAIFERKLMVIVPSFETVLSHANVNLRFAGCCSDSGFVDDIADKTCTIKRAKVYFCSCTIYWTRRERRPFFLFFLSNISKGTA